MEDEDLALYEAVVGLDKMGLSSKSKGCVSIYSIIYIYILCFELFWTSVLSCFGDGREDDPKTRKRENSKTRVAAGCTRKHENSKTGNDQVERRKRENLKIRKVYQK